MQIRHGKLPIRPAGCILGQIVRTIVKGIVNRRGSAMVAEAAVDLATAVRAGPIFNVTAVEGMPLLRLMPFQRVSLRCSRYGHMSRDCTQGSKCYNCKASLLMRPLISG